MIRSIKELTNVSGVHILIRLDLNVPIQDGVVVDPYRIERALPTVTHFLKQGAKAVLLSHMSKSTGSLEPVFNYLKKKIPVSFSADTTGPVAREASHKLKDGHALLLENIRRNSGEEENDEQFARSLAALGDVYVNDAFPVSHRAHASIVGVPKFLPSYAGFQFFAEVEGLTPALEPASPAIAMIGGAKLVTKQKLVETLLKKYDYVFVGGAIVNDFYKAKGYEVGKSLVAGGEQAKSLLGNSKIVIPEEVIVDNPAGSHETLATEIGTEDTVIDIAPTAIKKLSKYTEKARTILWNGPMGNFEKGFREGTDTLAKLIADSNAKSIVGGGDTLASIQSLNLMSKFDFVSTAGGAMLDFLANGTLPGIEALKASRSL